MKKSYLLQLTALTCALFVTSASFSQSCDTKSIETGLYSPSQMITCDFNGDGFQDIIFLDSLSNNLWWKRNLSDASFAAAAPLVGGAEVLFLRSGDLNNDAYDEIIIATLFDVYYIQYLSPTSIDFQLIVSAPGTYRIKAIEMGDFNNDKYEGFAIAYNSPTGIYTELEVITNVGGTLGSKSLLSGSFGIISDLALGDIDKNGYIDVATTGYSMLWFANSNLTFSSDKLIRSAGSTYGKIFLMDFNKDNKLDCVNLNDDGKLQSYGIDPAGITIYNPVTHVSGLPTSVTIWQLATENGNDVILTGSANEIIGLENKSASFTQMSYCSSINDLSGATQFKKKNGETQIAFSRESKKTLEMIELSIGINEVVGQEIKVYPNPTSNFVNINSTSDQFKRIEVINYSGQVIMSDNMNQSKVLDVSSFTPGVYFIRLIQGDSVVIEKIVIDK